MLEQRAVVKATPLLGVEASPATCNVTLLSAWCQKVLLKLDLERLEAF